MTPDPVADARATLERIFVHTEVLSAAHLKEALVALELAFDLFEGQLVQAHVPQETP